MIASRAAAASTRGRAWLACLLAMAFVLACAADGRAAVEVQLSEGSRQVNAQSIGCQGSPGCVNSGSKHEASGETGAWGKSVTSSSECPIGGFLGKGSAAATQSSVLEAGPQGFSLSGTGSATADAKRCATSDGSSNASFSFTVTGSPVNYTLGGLVQGSAAVGLLNSWGTGSAQVSIIDRTATPFVVVSVAAGNCCGLPLSAPVDETGTLPPGNYSLSVSLACHARAGHVDASASCSAGWQVDVELGDPPPPTNDPEASCDPPGSAGGVPVEDAVLACSARVSSGECVVAGDQDLLNAELTLREGEFWTMSPMSGGGRAASGDELTPEEMPAPETLSGAAGASAVLLGSRVPRASDGGCEVSAGDDAAVLGDDLVLSRPGQHLMATVESVVQYQYTSGDPVVNVCAGSLRTVVPAGFEPADPNDGDGQSWKPVGLCATRSLVHFNVRHPVVSPCGLDGANFPSQTGYLNQYAAGSRLSLPTSSAASGGQRGGNACGPSSLLMGMRQAKRTAGDDVTTLDALADVYREVMSRAPADGTDNAFSPANALAYLRSEGWTGARVDDSLGTAAQREQQIRDSLATGPVVISTAFSSRRWGQASGGHIILLHRLADDGRNVIVSDPAGDYFSARTGHYASTSCGRRVSYPLDWIVAFTAGRYLVELGAPGADPVALLVRDVDRAAADAAQDFWVQDAQGRRSGWIAGTPLSEIPGAQAFTDLQLTSDPDSDQNTPPDGAQPRALVITDPPADLQLRVRPGPGGYRLDARRYDGGQTTGAQQASGPPGGELTVAIPAVGLNTPTLTATAPPPALPTTPALAPTPGFGAATRVTLKLAAKRIPATGPVLVTITNDNPFPVTGRVTGHALRPRPGRRRERVPLRAKTYRAPAKARTTIRLALPKKLRSTLRRQRRLTIGLTATAVDPANTTRRITKTLTPQLKPPPAKRR